MCWDCIPAEEGRSDLSEGYLDFKHFPNSLRFRFTGLPVLAPVVSGFFGCHLEYIDKPTEVLIRRYGINIQDNLLRSSYIIDDETAIVLGRIMEGRLVRSAFAIELTNGRFKNMSRLLNLFGKALGMTLSLSCRDKFYDASLRFGDALIKLAIAETVAEGFYGPRKVIHLIELFHKLASSTFEGRQFTTGLILSKSLFAYAGAGGSFRYGDLFRLEKPIRLRPGIAVDKRFWYLVDGQTSFLMCEKNLRVPSMFVLVEDGQKPASFTDAYTLSQTLQGGDALFRVISNAEFSITTSDGLDFSYKENSWRVRDLMSFIEIISTRLDISSEIAERLLFYALYLSRRRLSSIIWIPLNIEEIERYVITQNKLTQQPLSIKEEYLSPTVTRLLSSDGVTIIDLSGNVHSFGCIVDSSKINVSGIKGTGESVARYLSNNGIALKISQDGNIKIFSGNSRPPTIF